MKKLISIILALTLIVSAFCLYPSAEVTMLGDADADGKITASDALKILQYAVGKTSENGYDLIYFNVDAKAMITAADALLVLQCAVGKVKTFPAANKFTGYIYADGAITVYKGQTLFIPVSAYANESFSLNYEYGENDPFYADWGEWMGDDIGLMVSMYDEVTATTSANIRICFTENEDVARTVKVTGVPQAPADVDYMFAPGVVDFGVYTKTAPYQMYCYRDDSGRVVYKMVYDGAAAANNSADSYVLVNYLNGLADKGFLANDQSGSGMNWHYDIENDQYHMLIDLVTNDEQTKQDVVVVITDLA